MNYLYSIIIPVYNAEKYLECMIDSVINQTYKNWELILVDDGSSDKSGIICDRYSDDRITVIHQENQGQVVARKNGILKATGDYTLVFDADDMVRLDCLELVNNTLNKFKYDAVMFPYVLCDEKLKPSKQLSNIPDKTGDMTRYETLSWVIEMYMHGLVDKAVRTDIIKKSILCVPDKKLKVNGDYALVIPIICNIEKAFFINEPLYFYRVYSGSVSHNYSFQHIVDTDYVSIFVKNILYEYQCYDSEMEKNVCLAYLHMISWMFRGLIFSKTIKQEEIDELHKKDFYSNSYLYEKRQYFNYVDFLELKLIRMKKGRLLYLIGFLYKIENLRINICGLVHKIARKS